MIALKIGDSHNPKMWELNASLRIEGAMKL